MTAVLIVYANCLSRAVSAQTAGSNATGIIQRANAAMGCNAIKKDTTISVRGFLRASSVPSPMPVAIDSLSNDRWRSELVTPNERKITVINAGKGHVQHADGSVASLAEHNTSHQRPMHIPCLTNLALPSGATESTYLRAEAVGSEMLDVIQLELLPPSFKHAADLMKTTVWISRSTGYLTKLEYVNAAEQDSNDSQTVALSIVTTASLMASQFRFIR